MVCFLFVCENVFFVSNYGMLGKGKEKKKGVNV